MKIETLHDTMKEKLEKRGIDDEGIWCASANPSKIRWIFALLTSLLINLTSFHVKKKNISLPYTISVDEIDERKNSLECATITYPIFQQNNCASRVWRKKMWNKTRNKTYKTSIDCKIFAKNEKYEKLQIKWFPFFSFFSLFYWMLQERVINSMYFLYSVMYQNVIKVYCNFSRV